jgi:hypothetical protein
VILTLADGAGNEASRGANVSVRDTLPPVVSLIADSQVLHLDGNFSAELNVTALGAVAADVCGVASAAFNKTIFNCTDVGLNWVEYRAVDVNGNGAAALINVTVVDTGCIFPVDCELGDFEEQACSLTCGGEGVIVFEQPILQEPANGGVACPSLAARRYTTPCFRPACPGQASADVTATYRFTEFELEEWDENLTALVIASICAAVNHTIDCSQISVVGIRSGSVIVEVLISDIPAGDAVTAVETAISNFQVAFPSLLGAFSVATSTESSRGREDDSDYEWGLAGVILVSCTVALLIAAGVYSVYRRGGQKAQVAVVNKPVVADVRRHSIPQVAWSGGRSSLSVPAPKTVLVRDDAALLATSGQLGSQRRGNDNRLLDELSKDLGTWEPLSGERVPPAAQGALRRASEGLTAVDFNPRKSRHAIADVPEIQQTVAPQMPTRGGAAPRGMDGASPRPMPFAMEPRPLVRPTAQFPSDARPSPAFGGDVPLSTSPVPAPDKGVPFPPVFKPLNVSGRGAPAVDALAFPTTKVDPTAGSFPKPPNPPAFSDPFATEGRGRRINFPSMPPPVTGSPTMPRRPIRPLGAGGEAVARFDAMPVRGAPRTVSES